jgi:hypothetical protein
MGKLESLLYLHQYMVNSVTNGSSMVLPLMGLNHMHPTIFGIDNGPLLITPCQDLKALRSILNFTAKDPHALVHL